MNIPALNYNQTFGKQALLTCNVKENSSNTQKSATLYKLDPENISDQKDVLFSKQTGCIKRDFEKARYDSFPNKEFYMLQNNSTGEVISCAQTSHHFRPFESAESGQYTLIEDAHGNIKYSNAVEPLFAYITKSASQKSDSSVFTAFDEMTMPEANKSSFSIAETGEYFIPDKNFASFQSNSEKKYNIKYLV